MRKSLVSILIGLMILGVNVNTWAGVTATDVQCNPLGCVNDIDIATSAVTEPKIATGAVTNAKIADGAVTDAKITGPISASKIEKPANVIIVALSGGDFTSIQAAIDSINPTVDNPYVIKVMPGTYTESVTMKSYVHLQGAGRDVTKITYGTGPWYVVKCENVVNVAIAGFTIDGYWGIYNNNASPTITGNLFKMSYSGASDGIYNSNASPTVRDNVFDMSTSGSDGVHSSGNSSPIISENQFYGNNISATGIMHPASQNSSPTITNNVIKGWGSNGIRIDVGNAVISDNLIEGNGIGIVTPNGPAVMIKNNTIRGNTSDGVLLYYPSNAMLEGNIITGNGGYGVNGTSSATDLIHNKITSNSTSDLAISGGHISFNIYDTITGSGAVGNYNLKSDGTPAPLP